MGLLFAGSAALVASVAIALWLPRRRATLLARPEGVLILLRGDRLDRPRHELEMLATQLRSTATAHG
jgi:hypothetical protein